MRQGNKGICIVVRWTIIKKTAGGQTGWGGFFFLSLPGVPWRSLTAPSENGRARREMNIGPAPQNPLGRRTKIIHLVRTVLFPIKHASHAHAYLYAPRFDLLPRGGARAGRGAVSRASWRWYIEGPPLIPHTNINTDIRHCEVGIF